jgi:hypothetical protein
MSAETPNHRFAWPFDGGPYRYFTNVELAGTPVQTAAGFWGSTVFAADETYRAVIAERRAILSREPARASALPHMHAAEWDALAWVFERFAREHPDIAEADVGSPDILRWRNRVTGTEIEAAYGDAGALGASPLASAAGEVVEDLFLLDDRNGALRLDAIAATFTGSWSSSFSLGMSFSDLHGPVPRVHGSGMVSRTERFLRALRPGEVVRRLNWSLYETDGLDAALESAHGRPNRRDRLASVAADPGSLRLRIEVQHLTRLPRTGAVLFTIATQLAPLSRLVAVRGWRDDLDAVVAELPEDMAEYKNFADVRTELLDWLRRSSPAPDDAERAAMRR